MPPSAALEATEVEVLVVVVLEVVAGAEQVAQAGSQEYHREPPVDLAVAVAAVVTLTRGDPAASVAAMVVVAILDLLLAVQPVPVAVATVGQS
jgi:hypothetical protein